MLFATTDLFNLRTVERSDKAAIIEVCGDRRVALSMSNMPHPFTEAHADAYLNLVIGSYDENKPITFAIADKNANRYLGVVGLAPARCREKGNLVSIPGKAELFFFLSATHQGQGIIPAASRIVMEMAFWQPTPEQSHPRPQDMKEAKWTKDGLSFASWQKKISTVFAEINPHNASSLRVARKLGFTCPDPSFLIVKKGGPRGAVRLQKWILTRSQYLKNAAIR